MSGRALVLLLLAALALGACGRKGDVRAPEDGRSAFVFPRPFPAPSSVLPDAGAPEESETAVEEAPSELRLEPRRENRLSPFPLSPERRQDYRF